MGKAASVVEMQEGAAGTGLLKKVWEYQCPIDPRSGLVAYPSGGFVTELNDNSLFICMGIGINKIFILNRQKQITWSAYPELWSPQEKKWTVAGPYRTNVFEGPKNLEKLVWGSGIK